MKKNADGRAEALKQQNWILAKQIQFKFKAAMNEFMMVQKKFIDIQAAIASISFEQFEAEGPPTESNPTLPPSGELMDANVCGLEDSEGMAEFHRSHNLKFGRKAGLWVCLSCGSYTSVGKMSRAAHLRRPCQKQFNTRGKRNLNRIARGLNPSSVVREARARAAAATAPAEALKQQNWILAKQIQFKLKADMNEAMMVQKKFIDIQAGIASISFEQF